MKNILARAIVLAVVVLSVGAACATGEPQPSNRAALVVVHENSETLTRCVTFSETEISGFDLVDTTDLDLNYEPSAAGAAICRLDGEGCTYPNEPCFCQCKSGSCVYWSYWRLVDGVWQYSNAGPANTSVHNGDVEGWVWGQGNFSTSADRQPPALTFDDICAAPMPAMMATAPMMQRSVRTTTLISMLAPRMLVARVAAQQQATPTTTGTATSTATTTLTPTASQTRASSTSTFTPAPTFTGTLVPTPTATQTLIPQPVIVRFGVDRPTVNYSETVTLVWEVANATNILLRYPGAEEIVQASGSKVIMAERSLPFVLIATNSVGEARAEASLTVNPIFSAPIPQTTTIALPAPAFTEAAPPPSETPTLTPMPTDTATALPTEAPTVTPTVPPTSTPIPTDTPTVTATETSPPTAVPTDTPIVAPTGTPVPALAAPVSGTGVTAPIAPAPDPNVQPVRLAPPVDQERERIQRLLLIGGVVFVAAAPILFAAIWFVVWSFWQEQ